MNIGIISANIGNFVSVKNMLLQIGFQPDLLAVPPGKNEFYDWIILPGVGAYDNGIKKLVNTGWFSWLKENHTADEKSSVLGICLGMQILCDGSEEGDLAGFGFIPGYFKKFNFEENSDLQLKVPHMCWNEVLFTEDTISWAKKLNEQQSRYYFVHSYHYTNNTNENIIGTTDYGVQFASAIKKNNIVGFQFHPEKSHKHGKLLLSEVLQCKN